MSKCANGIRAAEEKPTIISSPKRAEEAQEEKKELENAATGDAPMGSCLQPQPFFFGEDYTAYGIHVVTAAYLVLLAEALLLLLSLVVLPLTVISFDISSLVTIVANGGALLLALIALCRSRHKYLWPFIVVKACEILLYVVLFLTALVLSCTRPAALLHFMRWRIRTINHDNQVLHIVALLVFFFLYIVYCVTAANIVHRAFLYCRQRAIFLYTEERRLAFQHILYKSPEL